MFALNFVGQLDKTPIVESESDHCIALLLGTADTTTSYQQQDSCVVTEHCLKQAMKPHTTGYRLTHQLLYFLAGLNNGKAIVSNNMF